MPSATSIEFNQYIIKNKQSRGIAARNFKRKARIKTFWWENVSVNMHEKVDCFVLFFNLQNC